ncbi:transmembrane protein 145-like [Penaeus indicus]|uniref:transmembrane protein 145-like n=1 Tax=Penaeus indicus TaxID=29960 RepID=UPI00300D8385
MPLPRRRNLTCPRCQLHSRSFTSRSTPPSTTGPEARDVEEKPESTRQGVKLEATRVSNCASWLELYVIVTPPKMSTGDYTSSGPSKWAWLWACLVLFVVHSPSATEAKFIEGYLKTAEKWAFLTRFCFLSDDGTFSFDVEYDIEYAMEKILLYYDSPHQWPAVYKSEKNCQEREAVMKRENNQFINLTLVSINSECEVIRHPGDKATYHCKGSRSFRSVRERWWFIAISNCDSTRGLELRYRFTMTNGYDYWHKHFSADEFYILRTDLTALILQLGILFLSLLAASELKNRQLFHSTYRLYMTAVVLQVSGLAFLSLHYGRYGYNGVGLENSKLLGRVLLSIGTVVMVLMLLLMGKGFNITRGRLRQASAVRLTLFMCIYSITYTTLFIYEQLIFDPGEVLYLYESPAGYGLIVLRLLAWFMFCYNCFFTIKHYPEKSSFFIPFYAFYTLWFISGPIVIIISNHVIDKWVREKVVNGVELSITLLGHAFFLFLTRPSAANKNFPYHVRTSQITALERSTTGVVGNNTLDTFSRHAYAPDLCDGGGGGGGVGGFGEAEPKNFAAPDLFLVSGAVEMRPIPAPKSIVKQDKSFPHHAPGAPPAVFHEPVSLS